jgi:hypothetical protein
MTRQQIVKMTGETSRLVAGNKTGVAPRSDKHVVRLGALKAAAARQKETEAAQKK